jgi:excisionase family DNA binding protein
MVRARSYTIGEAARTLGVSKEAVRQAIKAGRLAAKLKRTVVPQYHWAISAEAVESYRVSSSHRLRGLKKLALAWAAQARSFVLFYRGQCASMSFSGSKIAFASAA